MFFAFGGLKNVTARRRKPRQSSSEKISEREVYFQPPGGTGAEGLSIGFAPKTELMLPTVMGTD